MSKALQNCVQFMMRHKHVYPKIVLSSGSWTTQ